MSSMPHTTSAPLTPPMTFPAPASRPCEQTEPERTPPPASPASHEGVRMTALSIAIPGASRR